jgi:drug/metabolite transporter (DMT)-like permease
MNPAWLVALASFALAVYVNERVGTEAFSSPLVWVVGGLIVVIAVTLTVFDCTWQWSSDVEEALEESETTGASTHY